MCLQFNPHLLLYFAVPLIINNFLNGRYAAFKTQIFKLRGYKLINRLFLTLSLKKLLETPIYISVSFVFYLCFFC